MTIDARTMRCITEADGRYRVGMTHAPFPSVEIVTSAEKQGYKRSQQHIQSNRQLERQLDIVLESQDQR